jgi:hypothetical protein
MINLKNDYEKSRLTHYESVHGINSAVEFAKRTLAIYRKCVLNSRKSGSDKPHYASLPEYRKLFIKSYLSFKEYLTKVEV